MDNIVIKKYIVKLIYITLICVFTYSCDYSPRCISAEDFGQPRGNPAIYGHNVESRYGEGSDYGFLQKTSSTYTGFILTGSELVIHVLGAWSPWSTVELAKGVCGTPETVRNGDEEYYGKVCSLTDDFDDLTTLPNANGLMGHPFKPTVVCPPGTPAADANPSATVSATNVCWFPHGLGVYVGFANDPVNGREVLRHLMTTGADSSGNHIFRLSTADLEAIKTTLGVTHWRSVKIYLRIHDSYYPDNSNGCIAKQANGRAVAAPTDGEIKPCSTSMDIQFVQGARKEDYGFLENASMVFIDPARDFISVAYHAFVRSASYQKILHTLWALFIAFLGIGYFAGFIQLSKGELLSALLRCSIVYALLSPTSWGLFNSYLVSAFWDGTNVMANMVLTAFNNAIHGSASSSSFIIGHTLDTTILQNVDDVMGMFLSEQLNSKIAGLLFSHELGWLLIIALYFAFFVFIAAMLKLTVILIFVFITLTILLALGPIFMLFAVFKYTRNLYFQQWLQGLVGVAIQPMMLFVFVGLFLTVVSSFLYEMLYYAVCWKNIFSLVIFDVEFWQITEVWNYNNGSPAQKIVDGAVSTRPNIDLISIFVLFLSSLLIRYVTDMVPKIAGKIAGGISLEAVGAITMQTMKVAELFAEEMGKSTLKGVYKRVRNKTISPLADKVLPTALARHVGGTQARKMEKARREVRKEMRKKGWSDKQIEEGFKSGDAKIKNALKNHFAYERAKDLKYGRNSLNPVKVAMGAMKGGIDNAKMSMQKAQLRAQGKKLTDAKKRQLKRSAVASHMKKAKEERVGGLGSEGKLDKKIDDFVAKKYGNSDLRSSLSELKAQDVKNAKEGKETFKDQGELKEALQAKMEEKGYSAEAAAKMIDKDLEGRKYVSPDVDRGKKLESAKNVAKAATGSSVSRIKNQFKDLPEKSDAKDVSIKPDSDRGGVSIKPESDKAGGVSDVSISAAVPDPASAPDSDPASSASSPAVVPAGSDKKADDKS